jgi:hypothetical protein
MQTRWMGPEQQQREIVDRAMRGINTAIPGKILSFDSATQTATIQPGVKPKTRIDDVEGSIEPPSIINAPIVFPFASTAGFALTIPIQAGDPCLIIFSQRAIDNWHDNGGVQPAEDGVGSRHHDMTDAFAILAPAPKPSVLGSWQSDGIELRNRARNSWLKISDGAVKGQSGTSVWEIKNDGKVSVTAPAGMTITGNVSVTGTITSTSHITSGDNVYAENNVRAGKNVGTAGGGIGADGACTVLNIQASNDIVAGGKLKGETAEIEGAITAGSVGATDITADNNITATNIVEGLIDVVGGGVSLAGL